MTPKEYDVWIVVDKNGAMAFEFAYARKEAAESMINFINDPANASSVQNKPMRVQRARLILDE
jgi:hypothetical protein